MADTEVIDTRALAPQAVQPLELSTSDILNRLNKIQEVQRQAMKEGIDYGRIPGTGSKPTLLKAGAEKLCVLFRLDAQCQTERIFDGPHLTATCVCTVYHQVTGERLGSATAMCSSKESKYAYRKAARVCPNCGKDAIIKGRDEYGGGWLCFKKKDGCGAKFPDLDPAIVDQPTGRVANEDVADSFPTVLRIAEKRALVAAVRLVTGASAIFDEDIADHDVDPADTFQTDAERQPTDGLDEAAAEYRQAFKDEVAARETDPAGIKATRVALIKKAKYKLGKDLGMKWLSEATKELGKTSDTLTIDDMLKLSERISNLKAPKSEEARQ